MEISLRHALRLLILIPLELVELRFYLLVSLFTFLDMRFLCFVFFLSHFILSLNFSVILT